MRRLHQVQRHAPRGQSRHARQVHVQHGSPQDPLTCLVRFGGLRSGGGQRETLEVLSQRGEPTSRCLRLGQLERHSSLAGSVSGQVEAPAPLQAGPW